MSSTSRRSACTPHDIERMNMLLQLRDKGNTVLVVEHKPEAIAIADHVVDLGRAPATAAGAVVFRAPFDGPAGSGHAPAASGRPRLAEAVGADTVRDGWRCAAPSTTT
jgi:hypothetical protein